MMRRLGILLLVAIASFGYAAEGGGATVKPYHLRLEAYPAAPFPYLSKFGTVTLDVYDGGVHADSFWLAGFSSNGSTTVTVENPVLRMYTSMPIANIAPIVSKLAATDRVETGVPAVLPPAAGKVAGIAANRYRISYSPVAWIDLWTTSAVPDNPQLRAIVNNLLVGISPPTAEAARRVPGTPVYVELNFRRFKHVTLLRLKSLAFTNAGETDALKPGSYYFKAPLLDAIWR